MMKDSISKDEKASFWSGVITSGLFFYIALPVWSYIRPEPIPSACEIVAGVDDDHQLIVNDATAQMYAIEEEFGPDGEAYFYQIGGPMPQELREFFELSGKMAEECSDGFPLWYYPTLQAVKARSKVFYPDGTPRK